MGGRRSGPPPARIKVGSAGGGCDSTGPTVELLYGLTIGEKLEELTGILGWAALRDDPSRSMP
jgi:hypothetical protein